MNDKNTKESIHDMFDEAIKSLSQEEIEKSVKWIELFPIFEMLLDVLRQKDDDDYELMKRIKYKIDMNMIFVLKFISGNYLISFDKLSDDYTKWCQEYRKLNPINKEDQ